MQEKRIDDPTVTMGGGATGVGGHVGVIDIGSNSIRLVVYDQPERGFLPLFNEKALCGLGKGLSETNLLSEEGVTAAFDSLARFAAVARGMNVTTLHVLATAAVRDAENGVAFVAEIENRLGFEVRVLSGTEEARLSALGVLCAMPQVDGVVGDLGGGSMELVDLRIGSIGQQITLPLGPLRLAALDGASNRKKLTALIDRHLDSVSWLPGLKGRPLYAVGGGWRSIAKAHMEMSGYPLHILHEYRLQTPALLDFLDRLQDISKAGLKSINGVSKRRVEALPMAALLMRRLLTLAESSCVVFSAYGLREGCLFDLLPDEAKSLDPLIESARKLAFAAGRFPLHDEELLDWTAPLFPDDTPLRRRLRHAACILSDTAWAEHPDYRAENVFWKVLRAPIPGFDHAGRAFVALALMARYVGNIDLPAADVAKKLLDKEQTNQALMLGLALRLAHSFTGGAPGILRDTPLRPGLGKLGFAIPQPHAALSGDVVRRRLDALAATLGLASEILIQ